MVPNLTLSPYKNSGSELQGYVFYNDTIHKIDTATKPVALQVIFITDTISPTDIDNYSTTTNANGYYSITGIPAGKCKIYTTYSNGIRLFSGSIGVKISSDTNIISPNLILNAP